MIKKNKKFKSKNTLNFKKSLKICKIIKLITNQGHRVNSLEVSQDENNLISGWQNSSIFLFQKIKEPYQKQKINLIGHTKGVFVTKFSFCNNFILSGALNGELYLWSLNFKRLILKYENIPTPVWDASFSKINPLFSTCGGKKSLFLWASDRIFPIRMFVGHLADVNVVKWHPSNKMIASGSSDGTSYLWDIRTAKPAIHIDCLGYPIYSLEFSHDGSDIYISGLSNSIDLWDIRANKVKKKWEDDMDEKAITNLAYSPKGNFFGYNINRNTVKIWDNYYFINSKIQKKNIFNNNFSRLIQFDLGKIFNLNFNENERLLISGIKNFY